MKRFFHFRRILWTFLLSILFFSLIKAQIIELSGDWLFKLGDDPNYKLEIFDDTDWSIINVPSHWENEGYKNYDGFAWYRIHFTANKKILKDELFLLLGKIDDADETYLNGKLLGSSGKFPPNASSAWNQQRIYKISKGFLKERNTLAVRVFDMGAPGGIHSGVIGIFDKKRYEKEFDIGPKKSFYQLVTSNGLISAVYNEKQNYVEFVYPHIFAAYDSAKKVKPFLKNLKLNINEKPIAIDYELNSHIIITKYNDFDARYFASFLMDNKIFYVVIRGKKEVIDSITVEYSPAEVEILTDELINERSNGEVEKYFLFSFNDSLHINTLNLLKAKSKLIEEGERFLQNELNFMKSLHRRVNRPKNLNKSERNLFEQSITILKMAQVSQSEIFEKSRGQILASLPPGMWNITWIRDAAYSINALIKLGLFEEAKNALQFFLGADAGKYKTYIHNDGIDYGIGMDYKISVCRYFGLGIEESDFNENGPNIEIDGFGLFLWVFSEYVRVSGDTEFARKYFDVVTKQVADVIIHSIEKNNLIRRDSGPWERHLPGKQFAYTSIVCANGLKSFADLLAEEKLGESKKYYEGFERLQKGIKTNPPVKNKFIKSNFESINPEEYDFYDASSIEAFNFGLIDNSKIFKSHLSEYTKRLKFKESQRGFFRVNNGDWYDSQEWVFLDLRIANAMMKFRSIVNAKNLLDWVTKQSMFNHNLIAELYEDKTSKYESAVPMVGFGAGAYISAQLNFLK